MCITTLKEGILLELNDLCCEMARARREEIIGRNALELGYWIKHEDRAKLIQDLLEHKSIKSDEFAFRHKDGTIGYALRSIERLTLDGQDCILSMFIDITERKKAEETLQMMRFCIDHAGETVFWTSREGRILYANDAACLERGYSREELLQMTVSDLDVEPNYQLDRWEEHFEDLKRRGTITLETRHRAKDGRIFPVEVNANYVHIGNREFNLAFVRDITERRQRQNRIAQLAAIVESSNDAIFGTSLEGTITSWNRGAEKIFVYTESEIVGKSVATLIPIERSDEMPMVLNRIGQGQHIETFESVVVGKDGKRADVSMSVSPVWDSEGRLVGSSTIARDITEHKWAEAERARLQSQILHAQKLESLGILAGGIAHDFNNLLTSVMGYAGLVLMELPRESPARSMIADIKIASQRAADLTSQMLAYSGKGHFVIQPLRLDALVNEMLRLLKTVVSKKANIVLNLEPATIEGDATQIRQVIMNVITNASDSLEDQSGEIRIQTGVRDANAAYLQTPFVPDELPAGRYAFFEVRDDGCGMTEETISKIFDPFFSTKFTGRGLGLAAVLGIVRGHHGTIKVESTPGQGSNFQVLFPCSTVAVAQPAETDVAALLHGHGTILIVEDDSTVRSFIRQLIERAGFNVLTAKDGAEGLEVFAKFSQEIVAVLLDLTMPQKDGLEVLRELRSQSVQIPVLVMSGYSENELWQLCEKNGANGFIQKPFNPHDLISRICELLQKGDE